MVFFNFRQGTDTVQGLLIVTPEKISKQMVKWAAGLADESIVLVEGIATKVNEPIKSATISNVEIHISKVSLSALSGSAYDELKSAKLHLVAGLDSRLPFTVEDATRPEMESDSAEVQYKRVLLETRLNNRVVELRVITISYPHRTY